MKIVVNAHQLALHWIPLINEPGWASSYSSLLFFFACVFASSREISPVSRLAGFFHLALQVSSPFTDARPQTGGLLSVLLQRVSPNCPSEAPSPRRSLTNGLADEFRLFICVVMRGFNQRCQGFQNIPPSVRSEAPPLLLVSRRRHTHTRTIRTCAHTRTQRLWLMWNIKGNHVGLKPRPPATQKTAWNRGNRPLSLEMHPDIYTQAHTLTNAGLCCCNGLNGNK